MYPCLVKLDDPDREVDDAGGDGGLHPPLVGVRLKVNARRLGGRDVRTSDAPGGH